MAERPLYTLYKNLKAQNYDVPDDYNKFESALTRDGKSGADNRHAIYENLKAQNFDVPDTYERFYSALFEPRSKTSSRAKGGSVPMSAADRARFSARTSAILSSFNNAVRQSNRNFQNKLGLAKKFKENYGKVTIGFKNPLQNQNVQKNEFNYNATTGKTGTYTTTDGVEFDNEYDATQYQNQLDKHGQQYINAVNVGEIPSVFDVRDKNGNYDLQENIGKNGTYLTEEGAQKQFDKKLADAYARKKEIEAAIEEDHRLHGNPLLSYSASIGASNGRTAEQSDYSNKLATSLALVNQQIGALEAVKQYPTSSWGEDALKALDNTAFTAKTWDFGLTDFATMGQMERIKTKMDNNIPLSGSDKMLLKSKLGADAAAALEDEKMGNIYRWTKIAGQSLPFMADFFLTGGYGGITKGISRGALKFAAKRGMGKVSAAILKNTGIVAGDVIGSYAMAGTEQALKTGADIMQRHLGNLYQDEKGDYKFGTFDENGNLLHEGGESMGTALYKGLTSAMVENYTEKLFGHNYGIKKGAVNFMEKHGMNASAEFFKNIGKSGWYTNSKKWMEKFGINGFGEEVMEEEIGIPLHALLDGEGKVSDLLDARQQLDIIGGMAISVGSMYAMGAGSRPVKGIYNRAQYYRFRNKVNVADSDAQNLMGDNWEDIKDKIDNATNEQMGSVLADILRQRDTMTKEQINAAVNYGVNLMKMRGYNIAKTAEMNAREITNEPTTPEEHHQADIDNAYSEGHDADDAEKHDIQIQHEDQMKTLAAALGISEQQLSAMSDEELESMTGQDDKLDQAIYDYQLSSARYQGVVDDAQDKVDLAAHQAEQRVDMYTDQSRGSVRNATIKASGGLEDYGVYIISGNIATNDDGSIDVSNSDDMILYYDPTTNSVEHADASMFAELGEELPADEVKAQAVADAKENAIKEVAGIIDGTVEVGSQFNVTDTDGTEHTYEVLADYGDGTAAISIDGNVVENPYSLADSQQMKDLEDQKRLEAVNAEREQMEKERAAKQTQETEQTQPSFDFNQILNDNGKVVLADVLGKDGNTKYPNSQLFLIRDSGAKAKVVELKSDGTLVPHAVNKKDVRTATTMTLDEYKQAFADSSMIEDNSGVNRGEIEVEAQTIEGETSAPADEAAAPESAETPATEQTPAAPAMTLEDGTIVPMLDDGNPDFSKLTAAQTAELYDTQFGEDAESVISSWVSDAKKALDKASNMTVKGKTFVEQKAAKDAKEKAIADAQAAYDSAIAIRDAYNERQLAKLEDTAEGRKALIEKARRKFARLKSAVKDDAEAVSQLYRETIGSLLHRLYDSTGIDVTDTTPLTAEEYVASNLGAHSLNYEGTETSKGVKQETGLSREDFAKTQLLAADGKGTTIDNLVHSLWENRPSNLESLDTQDIRNALLSIITSGFKASEARNFVENIRIAQAENILEEQKRAQENAAYAEQQKSEQESELQAKSEEKAELQAKSEEKTHSDAFNKIVDLAKNLEEILDNPDNVKEIDKITHEIDELLETLSDEEFKEVSDVLLNIDEDLEYLTSDEYERREGVEESKKAKAYNESLQQAIKRIAPYVDALKTSVNSGDKKAIAKAQKELADALLASNLGHGYLSRQLEYAKSAKKKDESYSERRALVKPLTDAINAIESALDSALTEAGLEGVHVDFTEGGHGWIYADNGSAWSSRLKALDNDYRNVSQYETQNPISVLPQVTMDNVAKVAGIIKSRIEEGERYNSDEYNDEENEKINEQTNENISAPEVPEDATDEAPLGAQRDESDLPFSAKENGKQQTTAERAADVEKNKVDDMKVVDNIVGQKTRKAFERLAKMMGANIQWQYSDKLGNGWIQETTDADGNVHRTIFITLDSSITEGAQFIFGHEMTHQIKNLNPAAYNELTQLVLDTYGSDAFDKAVDETMKRYSDAGFSGRARDYYAEEVVADSVGEMIRDLNLAHTLAMKMSHPLLAAIHEILQKIKLAFFGTEYSDVTKNIIRSIEQAYVKTANMEAVDAATQEGEGGQRLSLRTKPEPKKTQKVYKLMRLGEDGKLYPLFIGSGEAIELGKWYDADSPKLQDLTSLSSKDYVGTRTAKKDGASVKEEYHYGAYIVNNKTGEAMSLADFKDKYSKQFARMGNNPNKKAVDWATDNGYRWIKIEEKNQGQSRYGGEARSYYNYGINGSGSVSIFAMRPGWHAGSLPTMRQIGKGSAKNLRDDTFVWVEGEIPAEIDYNEEAQKNADKDIPDHIPTDGYYLKATNANKEASQADKVGWYVAGAFRANRIMSDKETRDIIDEWNAAHPDDNVEYDWKRESGKDFNAETMSLEDTPKFSLKVYHGSGADFTEFDFDHMGEGAGSQVFGWGGYVTSSEKIGKSYAGLTIKNRFPSEYDTPQKQYTLSHVLTFTLEGSDKNEAIQKVKGLYNESLDKIEHEHPENNYAISNLKERIETLDEMEKGKLPIPTMSLYEVDIPEDNGSNYLEWEKKPSDDVATKIIEGLYGLDAKTLDDMASKDIVFRTLLYDYIKNSDKEQMIPILVKTHALTRGTTYDNGNVEDDIRFVYNRLSRWMGSQKAASKFLSSLGFTGIKYPAGTIMGGAEEGDTNYVIFKPEDMKITEHTKFSLKSKPVRFEAGKKLSDEEKKEVLSTLKDAYKVNGVPYHIEETAGGKEKRVYEPTADSYVVSDITNRPLRYYITLPDGRVAHPTEVYPNISDNEVKSSATKQGLLDDEAYKIVSAAIGNMKNIADNSKAIEVLTELQNLPHETHDVGYGMNNAQSYNYKTGIFTSDAAQAIDYVVRRMRRKEDVSAEIPAALKKAVADSYGMVDNLIDGMSSTKFSLKDEKTLAGVHNITEEKLRKALKLGGFANPSLAVIDTNKTVHDNFGEISFIAPSALVDKRTGKTAGTWITDAYTQRYPSVEREMSEKGSQKFRDWVDSLEYPSEAKAEIKRQAEDALSNNNALAWELMYLKEKGIDIKEYDSRIDYRWKEIIKDYPTAEDILSSMQNDPELNEKVTSLAKHTIIHPTWEKVSLEVRRKMYEETGVKASPINPQVRKQTKEIFERDYAPTLLNKDGSPRKKDVKKVVEDIVKEHNDTKKYDFYLSKVKASNYVNKNGLYDDYIRWQENKLDEFGTKNRIFRGYTMDGSRKYVPETLENVSKAMRENANGQTNGSEYTTFGSFIAKLASRVDSTDEMRANKDKLSSDENKEFYEKWKEVYYDLAKFLYNDVFYGEQRLHDIVLQADPKKYAKKEYGITLTPTFMKKLDALKNAVQTELKSAYFETKYNRPLRLNEFAAAVVPDNLGEDVRKGIEKAGLPMYNYDPNKEGDRKRAFNEAINSSDNIRFSLAGERGAAAADKAEERTARMDNLSVARKMEEEKKDAKAIKIATGWERGADGKWRFEIPDFHFNYEKWKDNNKEILDSMDDKDYRNVMRYEKEFYEDLSPIRKKNFDELRMRTGYKIKQELTLGDVLEGKGADTLFKYYPEIRDVKFKFSNLGAATVGIYDSKTKTIEVNDAFLYSPRKAERNLQHEVQHVIQHLEGFAKGGNQFKVRGEVKKKFSEITKQIRQLRAEGKEDEAKALIEKNRGLYNAYTKNDDYNSYKSLAGEVEARNVQERMNMTSEERRKTLAESTEDVARKDQIFLGVGDVSFSLRDMADGKKSGAADMAEDLKSLNTPDEVDDAIKTAIDDMPSGWQMANKKMIHIVQALGENRKAEIAGEEPKFSLKDGTLIKAGTYFSGGGLVEEGLKGIIDPVVAVEYDEKISGVYRNNFGQHIVTADVRDVDPRELVKQIDGEVEYFHASPVCKNYSQAKSNHAEVELDKETAASTAEFINAIKPKLVTIENVKGYKDSEAMKIITDALDANGYTWDADVYNAADYGGYTNRERLIVRAVRDGKLPEKPKKMERKSGWYEAVADIIPTLTEKKNGVAPWMDIRLKADGIDWRNIDKPLYVMGSAYADGKIPHAFADELLPTLRTKSGDVIVMPDGKVYRAIGRVLARVSGVSDDYKMPFSENLSHTIIGNGIPTQLTEHVIAPLLTGSDPKFSLKKTNNVKDSRIIPTDVDKSVSLQIEKKYDSAIKEVMNKVAERDKRLVSNYIEQDLSDFSKMRREDINQELKSNENWRRKNLREENREGSTYGITDARHRITEATAERELEYRDVRAKYLSETYGLQGGRQTSLDMVDRAFEDTLGNETNRGELRELYGKARKILVQVGAEFGGVSNAKQEGDLGFAGTDRDIYLFIDTMTRTSTPQSELAHTILHEMIHQATVGSINLVKKGMADGMLTPKQIEAVNTIINTYDAYKADRRLVWEEDNYRDYGGKDEYEFAAEMADAKQRRILSIPYGERILNAANELKRVGDISLWQAIKNALRRLFEFSDKSKMDKALTDIMDDFNKNIDDISMNKIEQTDFGLNGNTRFSLRYDQFEHDLNQWKKDNNLPKDAQRPTIPQRNAGESAVDFLRRVDEYRKQMALWKTAPTYEQHLLSDDTALGEFNRELQRGSVLKRIAFQDSMLAIRKAQEAIMKEVGVDRLNMAEDAYTAENRSHGKGKNEFEEYNNEFLQPLRKAYHQMKKVLGDSYDNVRIYMMAKHGLERDAQMAFKMSLDADYEDVAQRSAAYKAYKGDMNRIINDSDLEFGRVDFTTWRQRDNALRAKYSPSYMNYRYDKNGIVYDYSGLSALFDGSDFEEAAYKLVKDIEDKYVTETHNLWDATNAATKKILRDGYKAGMMSKDTYQYVRDMYSHYIPLRGWDGTTADQVWDYVGGGKGAFNQTLKTAHGRTSISDDPIAYIENMAESGILLNNKNWVKQHLMLLAQNHPTSLLTLSKAWYVKSTDANGNEEWIPATPQITSQMNSNQVKAAIDAFEKKMEQMAQTGDATQKRDGLNIAYPQTHSEEREHEVRVMKDGEEYVIYVNGDPQLAQAMNNTRAHRVSEIQSGKLDRAAAWLGRKMAAAYTSLSPLFIPSNYFRDLTMTLASTAIREDAKYNYLLRKNLATSWNLGFMLRDFQNGKLRDKVNNGNATPKEKMFYDFMMNGGETGFVSSLDVEDLKKKFKNDLKDLDKWKANPVKVGHTIMDCIEFLNRAIEDSNRFAVYMTSIQYGRSIDEAVNDAKNVTLNFNRKGTGEYGWQTIRNLYLFINPAVQSLQTFGALAKHHPFKFTAVTASWLASGVLVPIVNAALMQMAAAFGGGDGDDDKEWYKDISNKYWKFSKWDRRNNFIMWVPFTHEFIKIPLAQEFRAFYGVGDMIASKMMGGELAEESWSQYAEDLLGQVVDMLPLDPTGYDGNIAVSLMPNPIRPVFELAFNVDFTGKPLFKETEYNKYDPNFTKAYVGTPDWLVRASKMVNSIGNDYPDVQQNSIDAFGDPRYNLNNPAVVDHVLSSYLGGAYTMGSQVLGFLTKSLNDPKEIKVADIPLFSKFVSNPDDRPVTKKQGDEFWNMKENHDRAANTLSKLKKQAKVDGDYSMLERFYGSEEYKQYKQDDVKVKKYEEDKKKERAEESGEEYRPHKLNAEDIYKAHATSKDDFEDLKLKQLYTKLNGFKTSYDLLVNTAPSQSDGYYNTNKAAIDAIDEIALDKQEISELKKGFLDDGKDSYNAEDMKRIRELRKKILAVLEKANKVVVANQKAKAEK